MCVQGGLTHQRTRKIRQWLVYIPEQSNFESQDKYNDSPYRTDCSIAFVASSTLGIGFS